MDITVRRTGAERSWSLEDLLGRPMGTITEYPPGNFTIHPEGQRNGNNARPPPWPLCVLRRRVGGNRNSHARCLPDGRGSRSVAEIDPAGSAWGPQKFSAIYMAR